jgi:3-hydroxyethyl bacteriochlorophyllide a dehydrogenase
MGGEATRSTTPAVLLEGPGKLRVTPLALTPPGREDVVVAVRWSGISTGTERLLYTGTMPPFPGLAYPLVPGYESVGEVVWCGPAAGLQPGEHVFVPGARCYRDAAGLFGGAARRLVVPAERVVRLSGPVGPSATLLALAATALHALDVGEVQAGADTLVVGHGSLGRLLARLTPLVAGDARGPRVWETSAERRRGARGYEVWAPEDDDRSGYHTIVDVSGDGSVLDGLVDRLAPGGRIVLAGFYDRPLSFHFAPAFLREAQLRVAAQWQPGDLHRVAELAASGRLSLDGLVTHQAPAQHAEQAYRTAFEDARCLKMVLDWRDL